MSLLSSSPVQLIKFLKGIAESHNFGSFVFVFSMWRLYKIKEDKIQI